MTTISLSCEMFFRMAKVTGTEAPLNCIYIDRSFMVATNRKVMAIQQMNVDTGIKVSLAFTPDLLAQMDYEADNEGEYIVDVMDGIPFATGKTSGGYQFAGNAMAVYPTSEVFWSQYWSCVPESMPKKPSGSFYVSAAQIAALGSSSPSGNIVFPEFINNSQPTIVRDVLDPSWFGLFLSVAEGQGRFDIPPAKFPEWFKSE